MPKLRILPDQQIGRVFGLSTCELLLLEHPVLSIGEGRLEHIPSQIDSGVVP
jgi:hypothetical protein